MSTGSTVWRSARVAAAHCNAASARVRGWSKICPKTSSRSSPSTPPTATTARAARSTSSRLCPPRCPMPPSAIGWSASRACAITAWASRATRSSTSWQFHLRTKLSPGGLIAA